MNYQSVFFLLFSAAVMILYYVVGRRFQRYVLLLANIAFLAIAGIKYIPFVLVTGASSYFSARYMGKVYREEKRLLA